MYLTSGPLGIGAVIGPFLFVHHRRSFGGLSAITVNHLHRYSKPRQTEYYGPLLCRRHPHISVRSSIVQVCYSLQIKGLAQLYLDVRYVPVLRRGSPGTEAWDARSVDYSTCKATISFWRYDSCLYIVGGHRRPISLFCCTG